MSKFIEIFSSLPDPRIDRCKKHELSDILYITIVAVLCGANDWEEIEEFGQAREEWFMDFLKLPKPDKPEPNRKSINFRLSWNCLLKDIGKR